MVIVKSNECCETLKFQVTIIEELKSGWKAGDVMVSPLDPPLKVYDPDKGEEVDVTVRLDLKIYQSADKEANTESNLIHECDRTRHFGMKVIANEGDSHDTAKCVTDPNDFPDDENLIVAHCIDNPNTIVLFVEQEYRDDSQNSKKKKGNSRPVQSDGTGDGGTTLPID